MEARRSRAVNEPVDPDVDPVGPGEGGERDPGAGPPAPPARGEAPVVAAVALGGALGAAARYGASLLWPTPDGAFPWTTLAVNAAGCAVIGAFMVLLSEEWSAHRLVRPFFGTGVLGGFTTFSTYAVDVRQLADAGAGRTALAYLGLTPLVALAAVWTTAVATRRALARGRGRSPRTGGGADGDGDGTGAGARDGEGEAGT
ncbi:CrcB family protein [Streptomyces phytohabitans]|uniref:fluoride efflux transporter FluC n=1 Tax=Streptomyces phytohabitans TaxID=1150371 RepID=UPI00345BA6D2